MTGRPSEEGEDLFFRLSEDTYINRIKRFEDYSPYQVQFFRYWAVYLMKCWLVSPNFRKTENLEVIKRSIGDHIPDSLKVRYMYSAGTIARLWEQFEMGKFRRNFRYRNLVNQEGTCSGLVDMFDTDMDGVVTQFVGDHPELRNPECLVNKSQSMVAAEYDVPPRVVKSIFKHLTDSGDYGIKVTKDKETKKAIKALIELVNKEQPK